MPPNPHPAHGGPYRELSADAARDLRRPIAPDEVRFKVQAVRWSQRDGQQRQATAAQVVAYIDARTVVARLNLLFPGRWHAHTEALPLEMRLTRRKSDGTLTAIRLTDQGAVKADDTLYYRCRLAIGDAAFEDVGAGEDPRPPTPTRSSAPPCGPASASPCTRWTRRGCASATPSTSCASPAPASPISTSAPSAGCAACTRLG